MKNYVTEFRRLFEVLKENSSIEVLASSHEISVNERRSAYAYDDLIETFGYQLPEEYKGFFDISENTRLRFVYYLDKEVKGGGEFHLNFLYDTLISLKDPQLWHESMPPESIEMLKTFRVVDDHPDSGDSKLAAFSIKEGENPPQVPKIFFYDRGDYFPMTIDYGGYLDAVLDLAGVSNWQYLFCDVDLSSPELSHIQEGLRSTLDDFRLIFPDNDLSEYYELLKSKSR